MKHLHQKKARMIPSLPCRNYTFLLMCFALCVPQVSAAQEDDLFSKEQPNIGAPAVAPFGGDAVKPSLPVPEDATEEEATSKIVPYARLAIIDKRNTTREVVTLKSGSTARYGHMEVTLQRCWQQLTPVTPEHAALVQLSEPRRTKQPLFFYGWLFRVHKSLSHPEHPLYDVVLLECREEPNNKKRVNKEKATKGAEQKTPTSEEEATD
jgi:hypothetical protein